MDYSISVITAVYNAEKYVQRAFASLKAQTIGFDKIQVIMVDDRSTDGSFEVISKWREEFANVTVMQTDGNSGSASVPRNLGLTAVKAPYIMFLDNDDYLEPDACEKLYNEIESSKADIVTGYYRNVDENDNHLNERCDNCGVDPSIERKEYSLPQEYINIREVEMIFWCKIYKADIIKANNLSFIPHSANEDIVFLAQYMLLCKKLVYINTLIYNCNTRTDSLSRSLTSKYLIDRAQCYAKLLEVYTNAGMLEFFDTYYAIIAVHNLRNIFTSDKINAREQYIQTLDAWSDIIKYIVEKNLSVVDDVHRDIFTDWANKNYDAVIKAANPVIFIDDKAEEFAKSMRDVSARCAQLAEQNDGQQRLIDSLNARNAQLAEQNDGQQKAIVHLNAILAERTSQMDKLSDKLDAIRRDSAFKMAAKLSKNLREF